MAYVGEGLGLPFQPVLYQRIKLRTAFGLSGESRNRAFADVGGFRLGFEGLLKEFEASLSGFGLWPGRLGFWERGLGFL